MNRNLSTILYLDGKESDVNRYLKSVSLQPFNKTEILLRFGVTTLGSGEHNSMNHLMDKLKKFVDAEGAMIDFRGDLSTRRATLYDVKAFAIIEMEFPEGTDDVILVTKVGIQPTAANL